jgi:hypothetical protein
MKKIFATTAILASSVAFAGDYKFNLEGRYDFVNSSAKQGTVEEKYNNFSNSVIRLNMLAQVNEQLSFRFRYRYTKSGANPNNTAAFGSPDTGREYNGSQIDYLYADYKNQWFTTRFGKQNWAEAMGRELFPAATDVFVKSQANSDYSSAFGSDYRAGVSAIFKMDANTMTLAVSNPNTTLTDTSGNEIKNTGLALGAFYNGSFMEKLIQPVFAYQTTTIDGDTDHATATSRTKKGTNTAMALGLRSEFSGFTLDADYKQVKRENRNTATTAGTFYPELKTTSMMATLAYAYGSLTPWLTYINDKAEYDDTTSADYKKSTMAAGLFWKPMADVNFRYHLVYASSTKEKDGTVALTKIEDKKIYLGFKADI